MGIVGVSTFGLLTPDFYAQETPNWQAQSTGQDLIDLLLIAPVLLISSLLMYKGNRLSHWIWAGTNLYLVYTFAIYTFSVQFNSLFLFYCINFGLAFYSFLLFLYGEVRRPVHTLPVMTRWWNIAAYYQIIVAIIFYLLWLMDVIPAMWSGYKPQSLLQVGLPTNPVHVIDLSIFLPGMLMTGWAVRRRHHLGYLFTPVILAFTILMNLTIGILNIVMARYGFGANWILVMIMAGLALFSLFLLIQVRPTGTTKTITYEAG